MLRLISFTAFATATLIPNMAFAETLGERISSIVKETWNPLFLLVVVSMAVVGVFLIIKGLMKAVEASQSNGRSTYGTAIYYLLAGILLVSLPDAAGIGMTSLLGSARGGGTLHSSTLDYDDTGMTGSFMESIAGSLAIVGESTNCLTSDRPATCMAENIAKNTIPMAVMALFAMVFIIGLISFAMTIIDISKGAERGDQSKGKVARLVTSALLMNAPLLFTTLTRTLLGGIDSPITESGLNTRSSLLSYPTESPLEVVKNYVELIGHAFTIMTFFGAWAFVRGIFMIKAVAEGRSQNGSHGMAATYIIAGILMANAKFSGCLILGTFGGSAMGAGFCG